MSLSVDLITRWKKAVEVNDCEEGMVNFWRTSKAKKSVRARDEDHAIY